MEKLLNKLLGMGRKPRGLDRIRGGIIYCGPKGGITFQHKGQVFDFGCPDYVLYNGKEYMDYDDYIIYYKDNVIVDTKHIFGYRKLLRELCSKESLLWQFVCENGMVKHEVYEDIQSWEHTTAEHSDFWYTSGDNYEFYLIESSLKDESELEDFLLQNIKIGNED